MVGAYGFDAHETLERVLDGRLTALTGYPLDGEPSFVHTRSLAGAGKTAVSAHVSLVRFGPSARQPISSLSLADRLLSGVQIRPNVTFNTSGPERRDMCPGVRATVRFTDPGDCPLAACSSGLDAPIEQVSRSASPPDGPGTVTEFLAPAGIEHEHVEPIFDYGSRSVYRVDHDAERCPSTSLGQHSCPVHRTVANDGDLTLVFHVPSFDQLQALMGELRDRHGPVDVRRLLQPPVAETPDQQVFVNRGKLTDRQREVLVAAYEMGYFERPKGANASELADELGIAQSTFTEHLVTAQRKLLEDILE